MSKFTPWGKDVKKALIELGQTQDWLAERVSESTGLYVDSSYMYKILTGQRSAPKIIESINMTLGLQKEARDQMLV